MPKLTKKIVDAAEVTNKDYFIWDDGMPGFGLRVFPSGRKSYLFQYRHSGRTRRIVIGMHGSWTPDLALKKAVKLRHEVNSGRDPSEERHLISQDITVSALCDKYLEVGCRHKKPSTIATDKGRILRHIKPLIGHLRVQATSQLDVEAFMKAVASGKTAMDLKTGKRGLARVRGGTGTAARTLGLLGAIFTFAQKAKLRADNPVRGVHKPRDGKRERFLTRDELGSLGRILAAPDDLKLNPNVAPAIKLLIMTGCRKNEILKLKWSEVDFEGGFLMLSDSKTGPRRIALNSHAVKLLAERPKIKNIPFVFPASSGLGNFTALQDGWEKIRVAGGFADLHLHDLRHSFATALASNGCSLLLIGKLLGHRDLRTTQIYAHLVDDAQRAASQLGADSIEASWSV